MLRQIQRNITGLKAASRESTLVTGKGLASPPEDPVVSFLQQRTPQAKERQWYAGVNLNHANAAIIRANLSGNQNVKQLLIYNYEDAIRWEPPKHIRSRNNRIPGVLASKAAEDKAFAGIRRLQRAVD